MQILMAENGRGNWRGIFLITGLRKMDFNDGKIDHLEVENAIKIEFVTPINKKQTSASERASHNSGCYIRGVADTKY